MDVIRADAGNRVWLIAVHVDEALEAVLLAGIEEPVNRALLVDFQVVGVEVVQEVAADDLPGRATAATGAPRTKRVGDEAQVFLQGLLAKDGLHELHKAAHDIVVEVLVVADGQDAVRIRVTGIIESANPI